MEVDMDNFKIPIATIKSSGSVNKSNKQSHIDPDPEIYTEDVNNVHSSNNIECPYKEPKWSQTPDQSHEYKFEVLKSGSIIEEIKNLQSKPYWLFGRLPEVNDIVMAHPTISRFHAVLQYRPKLKEIDDDDDNDDDVGKDDDDKMSVTKSDGSKFDQGWYIYDLGSTHGTYLNKMRIPTKTYFRVKVGHMIKLGGSTRHYILQGPDFDEEPESELSVTELKALHAKKIEDEAAQIEIQNKLREDEGIDWGMDEDASEETDLTINPYASTNNEELFLDDPKKTLRGFFEREGLELEYKVDEMSPGIFICRVELPIDDIHGKPIVAEVCHKGKKKECVVQCALEACRILDRHGVLRQSHHEPLKRRKPKDDSDEDDDFLDRTGDIERKKLRKIAGNQSAPLTYEDLLKQENDLLERIAEIEKNILRYQEILKRSKGADDQDKDLDDYIKNLSENSGVDKTEIRKLRVEQQRLKSEHQKIQRLIKIAKPVDLPPLNQCNSVTDNKKKIAFPLFGKRSKLKMNIVRSEPKSKPVEKEMKSDEEEIEDDETDRNTIKNNSKDTETAVLTEKIVSKSEISTAKQTKNEKDEKFEEISAKQTNENEPIKRQIGPAFIPKEILETIHNDGKSLNESQENKSDHDDNNDNNDDDVKVKCSNEEEQETDSMPKKEKRKRTRNHNKPRHNIDIDDSEELNDKEKYSGWLPPENQTGDGMTSLNEKFGY